MAIDPKLLDYCNTDHQRAIITRWLELGSGKAVADELGVHRSLPDKLIKRLRNRAARQGYAPGHFASGAAPGFTVGKVTIQRNAFGEVERTWERQSPELEGLQEALTAAFEGIKGDIAPCAPICAPAASLASLLTVYPFFDYHVGMLGWHREGGADWDLRIAEETGARAMSTLVHSSPASQTGVVLIGGDFLHFDGLTPVTPTHGHILDADSRFGKVVEVAIRLIRQLVGLALAKHENVILLIMEGNHDQASSLWLRKLFAALYEAEPRITVHDEELPYYVIEWGKVMLGFHHGHLRKNEALPLLFAAQFPQAWGRTQYRFGHTGHRHHTEVREHSGIEIRQHPTLAARDAYAARGGWIASRRLTALHYHREFGEVGTNTVCPEMIQ